jgi:hypothetical protein
MPRAAAAAKRRSRRSCRRSFGSRPRGCPYRPGLVSDSDPRMGRLRRIAAGGGAGAAEDSAGGARDRRSFAHDCERRRPTPFTQPRGGQSPGGPASNRAGVVRRRFPTRATAGGRRSLDPPPRRTPCRGGLWSRDDTYAPRWRRSLAGSRLMSVEDSADGIRIRRSFAHGARATGACHTASSYGRLGRIKPLAAGEGAAAPGDEG